MITGLRQGAQNLAEGGPLVTVGGSTSQYTKKKLRNNSESEYRRCLCQLKKRKYLKKRKKQQPTEN